MGNPRVKPAPFPSDQIKSCDLDSDFEMNFANFSFHLSPITAQDLTMSLRALKSYLRYVFLFLPFFTVLKIVYI